MIIMALNASAPLRLGLIVLLLLAGMAVTRASEPARPAAAPADTARAAEPFWKIRARVWNTRPQRLEWPLRAENISDAEVRQIQAAVRGLVPGATVNIGGVTLGCPCEDGAGCTEQVWVVAHAGAEESRERSKLARRRSAGPAAYGRYVRSASTAGGSDCEHSDLFSACISARIQPGSNALAHSPALADRPAAKLVAGA